MFRRWQQKTRGLQKHSYIVWGRNWDLIFPIEQLHEGVIL